MDFEKLLVEYKLDYYKTEDAIIDYILDQYDFSKRKGVENFIKDFDLFSDIIRSFGEDGIVERYHDLYD